MGNYTTVTSWLFIFNFFYQIAGDLDIVKDALVQVTSRLRANLFEREREREREGAVSALVPVLPYLPTSPDSSDGYKYEDRDVKRHGRGHSYGGGGYGGSSDLPPGDGYGSYGGLQVIILLFHHKHIMFRLIFF